MPWAATPARSKCRITFCSFPGGIGLLHPVNYHPEHFDATDYFLNPEDLNNWMLWIAACHKSPEWADEREWRYIDVSFRDRHPDQTENPHSGGERMGRKQS